MIELLIVILIVGILIAVAAPSFLGQTDKAHDSEAKQYLTIAYKAAKASTVVEPYTGDYDVAAVVDAINEEGSGLSATTGNCPFSVTSQDPRDIIVDDSVTGGANLKICNDPVYRVWSLTVINHGPPEFAMVEIDSDATTPDAPVASGAGPSLSGTAQEGFSLATTDGDWDNDPTGYAYAWLRCDDTITANIETACSVIAGETASVYIPTSADVGKYLRSRVTASNAGGDSSPAFSNASSAILPAPPVNNGAAPSVSGQAREGETLTASAGGWSGSPSFAYSWLRCDDNTNLGNCSAIGSTDATDGNTTYTLVAADIGKHLRTRVAATNAGNTGDPVFASSAATSAVLAAVPVSSAAPSLSGGPAVQGNTWTVSNGSWTSSATVTYAYSWQRCNAAGASCVLLTSTDATDNNATYTLTSADVGSTIRGRVIATNSGGASAPAVTAASAVTTSTYSQSVAVDSPRLYWRFNESSGSTASDSSGNGNTGTLESTTAVQWGAVGSTTDGATSATFNGTAPANVYSADTGGRYTPGAGSFTIEAWARTSETTLVKTIIAKGASNSGATSRYYMRIQASTGQFHGSIADGTNEINVNSNASGLHNGQWHHFAMVVDRSASQVRLYIDGALDTTVSTGSVGAINNSASFSAGFLQGASNFNFYGQLDEVALYMSALSTARIQAHYNAR